MIVMSVTSITNLLFHMHACNQTKKFISYLSHLAMDAKYIIMANTDALVGPWKCDGAEPVSL